MTDSIGLIFANRARRTGRSKRVEGGSGYPALGVWSLRPIGATLKVAVASAAWSKVNLAENNGRPLSSFSRSVKFRGSSIVNKIKVKEIVKAEESKRDIGFPFQPVGSIFICAWFFFSKSIDS